jgi:methionyl aminopeptidase
MTEKDYSGATTAKIGKNAKTSIDSSKQNLVLTKSKEKPKLAKQEEQNESEITKINIEAYKKAGQIAKQVKDYAKSVIKPEILLSEIAEKIESKITELGAEVAFPVNLSIDDVAAHYTPKLRDDKKASGLLKVDIGVHVKGCIADLAFTLDLTPEKKYSKLIEASEQALKAALEEVKKSKENTTLSQIGKAINEVITKAGFSPIVNLSGHGLGEYNIHSGITIPNYDNKSDKQLGEGAFAIEPFSTLSSGAGMIYEGAGSNIYHVSGQGVIRDPTSREIISYIMENKQTLPFSQRELEKKFGTKALIAIANLKRTGVINEFPQLVEKNHQPVSQAETSFIIHNNQVEILVE